MKNMLVSDRLFKLGLVLVFAFSAQAVAASTIFGTVYDSRRNSLANVDVELLDQYHSMQQHTRTDGVGKYTFDNVSDGDWYIRVLPFRYDFDEDTQPVQIYTISQSSSRPGYMAATQDFILMPRKGTLAEAQASIVFAQEIPDGAKKSFDLAVKSLKRGKPDEAIPLLESAVTAFPNYFMANYTLGALYYEKQDYEHAAPPLIRATQTNDKSGPALYYLGCSLGKLNYHPAAIVALKAAAIIIPASPAVFTALGSEQRIQREYPAAEKSLLTAKKLQKTETVEVYRELAALYGETRQFEKGAASLEQMLKVGTFSDADAAKIKEQVKAWKTLAVKYPVKPTS